MISVFESCRSSWLGTRGRKTKKGLGQVLGFEFGTLSGGLPTNAKPTRLGDAQGQGETKPVDPQSRLEADRKGVK